MGLNPKSFYQLTLNTGRIHQLNRRDALELLEEIKNDLVARISAERAQVVADEVADQIAYHKPGAKARAAAQLNLSPQRISQMIKEHEQMKDDTKATRVAYDFGGSIHVMDIDAAGVWVEGTDEVLPLNGDRDETLEAAGYRTVGDWVMQGEVEGITVERQETVSE